VRAGELNVTSIAPPEYHGHYNQGIKTCIGTGPSCPHLKSP
jgi:hypothetical protein